MFSTYELPQHTLLLRVNIVSRAVEKKKQSASCASGSPVMEAALSVHEVEGTTKLLSAQETSQHKIHGPNDPLLSRIDKVLSY